MPDQKTLQSNFEQRNKSAKHATRKRRRRSHHAHIFAVGVFRTIWDTIKRFLALVVIASLGVTMIVGLRAACVDLRAGADAFFDTQRLFDIRVVSTLGLTDDDVEALTNLEGVEAAEGGYSQTAYVMVDNTTEKAEMRSLPLATLNEPYVLAGTLPTKDSEVAVTQRYLEESGLQLGDSVTLRLDGTSSASQDAEAIDATEDETTSESLATDEEASGISEVSEASSSDSATTTEKTFTITAEVLDPQDINSGNGTMGFRSAGQAQFAFFVKSSQFDQSAYSVIYLRVEGADVYNAYSHEYTHTVDVVMDRVQALSSEREQAREQGIKDEIINTIQEAVQPERDAITSAREQIAAAIEAAAAGGPAAEAAAKAATQAQSEQLDQAETQLNAKLDERIQEATKDIEATWYIQDRTSLSSFSSVDSDSSSIEVIGTALPVLFVIVAILVSLTTMTRMVEEERGLIGLYKALGYTKPLIFMKYGTYAFLAATIGWGLGLLFGLVVLPKILFHIFHNMYALPSFPLLFVWDNALISWLVFAVAMVGATLIACIHELKERPSQLMRPEAPKRGSRMVLERVSFIWRRLSFLHKVCMRNIIRYKRRFLMTVFGIAGCTALLVCGFGIKDTVVNLPNRQYDTDGILKYDLMAVASSVDTQSTLQNLAQNDQVKDSLALFVTTLTAKKGEEQESVQLFVSDKPEELANYLTLKDVSGASVVLDDSGALLTNNAADLLGIVAGDTLQTEDTLHASHDVPIAAITTNYLGNMLIMTKDCYENTFDTTYEANTLLAHVLGDAEARKTLCDEVSRDTTFLSVTSTDRLIEDFSSSFALINTVIYVVIVLAAALAFTVVFTLSTTNISERAREIATIKVLGFKRSEVHRYINNETIVLTVLGGAAGLPLGYGLARGLGYVLKMPAIYFDMQVAPLSYLIGFVMACLFTWLVSFCTNHTLDTIDMVGALKSVE